ncbi:ParB/RepB/Spo0J family partition protein [Streptomyces rameus]
MEPLLGNGPVRSGDQSMACLGESDGNSFQLSDVIMVPIDSLQASDSPRSSGEDAEHIRTLAESGAELPPIVVMRSTLRVIDGMHRLRAAGLRGATEIAVRYFEGEEKEAFVLAVKANIAHGLPLSLDDRKAAASRILSSHPLWSDRAIGRATGLSAATVGTLRSCSTAGVTQSNVRVGRDGRTRPLDATEGRRLAARFIQENPTAPLRQIAAQAGVSLGTASDVRKRLRRGESPLPGSDGARARPTAAEKPPTPAERAEETVPSRALMLRHLSRDPSIRLTEDGRVLLRWLNVVAVRSQDWDRLLANVPPHRAEVIAELARGCAEIWQRVAEQLERADADRIDEQVPDVGDGGTDAPVHQAGQQ